MKALYSTIRQALAHVCRRANNYFVTISIKKSVILFGTKIAASNKEREEQISPFFLAVVVTPPSPEKQEQRFLQPSPLPADIGSLFPALDLRLSTALQVLICHEEVLDFQK
jgi:hypothetical protein